MGGGGPFFAGTQVGAPARLFEKKMPPKFNYNKYVINETAALAQLIDSERRFWAALEQDPAPGGRAGAMRRGQSKRTESANKFKQGAIRQHKPKSQKSIAAGE